MSTITEPVRTHEPARELPLADRVARLRAAAYQIRLNVLDEGEAQGEGYVGQALGIADVLGPVRAILIRGSSADRQLAIYRVARDGGAGRIEALHAVVDWLIAASLPAPALSRAGHPDDDSDGPRHTAPATAAVP